MERLTYDFAIGGRHCWEVHGADNLLCSEVCKNQGDKGCEDCPIRKTIDRLAAYEDTGLTPEEIMGLCSMDRRAKMAELLWMEENKPLALDDLQKMDGTPVWITKMDGSGGVWMLVDAEYKLCREAHGEMAVFENCGKTWLAYRYKPEEEQHEVD